MTTAQSSQSSVICRSTIVTAGLNFDLGANRGLSIMKEFALKLMPTSRFGAHLTFLFLTFLHGRLQLALFRLTSLSFKNPFPAVLNSGNTSTLTQRNFHQ